MSQNLFEFFEQQMKKASKPLLSGRAKAPTSPDSQKSALEARRDKAKIRYPFDDISPDIDINISPRAKRMALRVDTKQRKIKLVIPKRTSINSAYEFALKNKSWILRNLAELPQPIAFDNGAIIPVMGQNRAINIAYNPNLKKTDIQMKNNEILVSTNKKDASMRIRRFLITLAKEELTTLAHEKAALIDKKIDRIDVKDTSSRWGSCSHDGRISFSWRLIFAPLPAFDYVVAHEVAHLKHLDHSPAFWQLCEKLSNQYGKGHRWMRDNGSELMRYDG